MDVQAEALSHLGDPRIGHDAFTVWCRSLRGVLVPVLPSLLSEAQQIRSGTASGCFVMLRELG